MLASSPTPADGSGAMFDGIAGRYDLLNRCTSFGMDRYWRRRLVASLQLGHMQPSDVVLDLATGTADVALRIVAGAPGPQVLGVDPSPEMLAIAAQKWQARCAKDKAPQAARLQFAEGDAQALGFADNHFAAACMAFGIRNVPNRGQALRELARVVRPGGRIGILELTEPKGSIIGAVARFYVHSVVPRLGAWLSGASAYRYLEQSITAFVPPAQFVTMMQQAGLQEVRMQRLSFGAVHLFTGVVPS